MVVETKYDIGQEVWYLFCDIIVSGIILEIIISEYGTLYKLRMDLQMPCICVDENKCFTSKEELLKSLQYERRRFD